MKKVKKLYILLFLAILGIGWVCYIHFNYYSIPKKRLAPHETYAEMKEDDYHHYINFQGDYKDSTKGKFRGFYLLSPNFYKNETITFFLTDGQMELVTPTTNFKFFEDILGNTSYVLIGVRGHSPTLLPEIYKNGEIDYSEALNIYSSEQQVEDIEQVRLDLVKKGILTNDNKINIFGASGAGVLAQQYLSKYGQNVNRVILESTGAPDLSQKNGLKYSPEFKDYNPDANKILESYLKTNKNNKAFLCNILYQQGRSHDNPKETQLNTLKKLESGGNLFNYYFNPTTNLMILNYLVKSPQAIMSRIRWFELVGYDLLRYNNELETNILYEISLVTISDLIYYHKNNQISAKDFSISRDFMGEVLLIKGTEDVVFSNEINQILQKEYANAKLLFFNDGHRMQKNKDIYINLRVQFFKDGFKAEVFQNY